MTKKVAQKLCAVNEEVNCRNGQNKKKRVSYGKKKPQSVRMDKTGKEETLIGEANTVL